MEPMSNLSDLSPRRAKLIRECQRLGFARIFDLRIRDGEPVFDPSPRIVREVKFGGDNGPRPEADVGDFALKRQVQDLLCQLDHIGDGVIEDLVVKHGLPFSMQVAEPSSVA